MRNDKATIPLSTTSKTEQRPLLPLSNPLSQFEQPRHSFVDKVTLAGSRKLHTSEVAPVNIPAVDQWLGKNALLSNGYADADSDPQGDFSPLDVSLFDLAILAEVVHEEYPLYSIFKNQCYWFSHLILKAIIVISGLNKDANPGPDPTAMLISSLPATTPDSGDRMLTQNDFKFPSRQGTWRGMKISEITPIVLASVIGKYLERRVIELVKVLISLFLLCAIAKYINS